MECGITHKPRFLPHETSLMEGPTCPVVTTECERPAALRCVKERLGRLEGGW